MKHCFNSILLLIVLFCVSSFFGHETQNTLLLGKDSTELSSADTQNKDKKEAPKEEREEEEETEEEKRRESENNHFVFTFPHSLNVEYSTPKLLAGFVFSLALLKKESVSHNAPLYILYTCLRIDC